jgi:hypothetical protein
MPTEDFREIARESNPSLSVEVRDLSELAIRLIRIGCQERRGSEGVEERGRGPPAARRGNRPGDTSRDRRYHDANLRW